MISLFTQISKYLNYLNAGSHVILTITKLLKYLINNDTDLAQQSSDLVLSTRKESGIGIFVQQERISDAGLKIF